MRRIIRAIIIPLAQAILRKYHPVIIAVTGTVGKTSVKNALRAALTPVVSVRASEKNNNTELGAAVTVIGLPSPGRSPIGWLIVCLRGVQLLVKTNKRYPKMLVLEFGAQQPGDIDRLCKLFPPTIGVLTTIGATHGVHLGGIEGVIKEKTSLLRALPKYGCAILCADDERVAAAKTESAARVIRYGFSDEADVWANKPHLAVSRDQMRGLFVQGLTCTVQIFHKEYLLDLPMVMGDPPILSALAALAVVSELKLSIPEALEGLKRMKEEKGRLHIIEGIKYATLIDDTYNASTDSMIEALKALRSIPLDENEERIAVLGDMREMGEQSPEEHAKVGRAVVEQEVDRLVVVGEMSRDIARAAEAAGMPRERIAQFPGTEEAGKFVQGFMKRGDLILIKGSRGMHMEAVVKELMAEPLRAEELLEFGEPTT